MRSIARRQMTHLRVGSVLEAIDFARLEHFHTVYLPLIESNVRADSEPPIARAGFGGDLVGVLLEPKQRLYDVRQRNARIKMQTMSDSFQWNDSKVMGMIC